MVDAKGEMTKETLWPGVFVKKADPMVLKDLDESCLLYTSNKDQVLPLTADKLEGKTVYVEYFSQKENPAQTEALRKNLAEKYGIQVTEDYNQADYAILLDVYKRQTLHS